MQKNGNFNNAPRLNTVGKGVNDGAALQATGVAPYTGYAKRRKVNTKRISDDLKYMIWNHNRPEKPRVVVTNLDKLKLRLEASTQDAFDGEDTRRLTIKQYNNITKRIDEIETDCVLMRKNETGTPLFRCYWDVYCAGELVGELESGGRLENMARYDYLTFKNEIIWQKGWSTAIAPIVIAALNTKMHSVAHLDICIDGLNDIVDVFNDYIRTKKSDGARVVRSQKGSPKFGANAYDDKIGMFDHYYIGTKGADKRFIIYEKNQEISYISPHKEYIRDTWKLNSMNTDGPVMRCELRLKGKSLDQFDIDDLTLLEDPMYLMQIFKTGTDGFVDFRVSDGMVNINDAIPLDIFGFLNMGIERLTLIKKNLSVGLYKAKMAIHSALQHCIHGDFVGDEVKEAMKHVQNLCMRFNLREYLNRRLPRWMEKYARPQIDVSYLHEYVFMIE